MILQCGNLPAAKDGFERKSEEKFGGRGEESGEGVGGRRDDGVNGEGGAQDEGR